MKVVSSNSMIISNKHEKSKEMNDQEKGYLMKFKKIIKWLNKIKGKNSCYVNKCHRIISSNYEGPENVNLIRQ